MFKPDKDDLSRLRNTSETTDKKPDPDVVVDINNNRENSKTLNKPTSGTQPFINSLGLDNSNNNNCDDESKLNDEMLFRASHPKKIGILSSGGLSNQIIDEIRNEYLKLFPNSSFEISFETLNRFLTPIQNQADTSGTAEEAAVEENRSDFDDHDAKYKAQYMLHRKDAASSSSPDPGEAAEREALLSPERDPVPISELVLMQDDEEYIFEPDSDHHDMDTLSENEHLIKELPPGEDPLENSQPTDSTKTDRPLTFKERAHQIFYELKKKLGFIKPHQITPTSTHTDTPTSIHELDSDDSEIEATEIDHTKTRIDIDIEAEKIETDMEQSMETKLDVDVDHDAEDNIEKTLIPQENNKSKTREDQKLDQVSLEKKVKRIPQFTKPDQKDHTQIQTTKPLTKPSASTTTSTSNTAIKSNLAAINTERTIQIPAKKGRREALVDIINDKDILFIVACLDDEYDIENIFVLLELAKSEDLLTIVISSLPRYFGKVENVYAMNKILQKLRLSAEVVILIPYFETIEFKLIPDLIKELIELITEPGLINVDVADLKIIVKGGNVGVITFGTGQHATRAKDAFFDALDSRLLNIDLPGVNKALLNVTGSKDMTLGEVEGIAEQIKKRLKSKARLILGSRINPELTDSIKLFILLGVTPMQVLVSRYATE